MRSYPDMSLIFLKLLQICKCLVRLCGKIWKAGRSWNMLQNEYSLAKIWFDNAQNGPRQVAVWLGLASPRFASFFILVAQRPAQRAGRTSRCTTPFFWRLSSPYLDGKLHQLRIRRWMAYQALPEHVRPGKERNAFSHYSSFQSSSKLQPGSIIQLRSPLWRCVNPVLSLHRLGNCTHDSALKANS